MFGTFLDLLGAAFVKIYLTLLGGFYSISRACCLVTGSLSFTGMSLTESIS